MQKYVNGGPGATYGMAAVHKTCVAGVVLREAIAEECFYGFVLAIRLGLQVYFNAVAASFLSHCMSEDRFTLRTVLSLDSRSTK